MAHLIQLHTVHNRAWELNRYVYPVISRRSRGLSVGMNLNPDKVCNFDCVYCCVDRTQPGADPGVDLDVLREELVHLLREAVSGELFQHPPFDLTPEGMRRLADVAFSGDGEPTACRLFPAACRTVVEALAAAGVPRTPIVLITNASLLTRLSVVDALAYLDRHHGRVWAKLDAGTEPYFRTVDRSSVPLERILENIRLTGRVRPVWIQSLFMRLHGKPPPESEIDAYVSRLVSLRAGGCQIAEVQVCTVARRTAEPFVSPLSDAEVDRIAERVRSVGIAAGAYYGPT